MRTRPLLPVGVFGADPVELLALVTVGKLGQIALEVVRCLVPQAGAIGLRLVLAGDGQKSFLVTP